MQEVTTPNVRSDSGHDVPCGTHVMPLEPHSLDEDNSYDAQNEDNSYVPPDAIHEGNSYVSTDVQHEDHSYVPPDAQHEDTFMPPNALSMEQQHEHHQVCLSGYCLRLYQGQTLYTVKTKVINLCICSSATCGIS